MIIVQAPLRISLFGGGTDLPEYADNYGSTIISFAINRHMYITHNDRPTGGCRLSYSQVEELLSLSDAQHTLIRSWASTYSPSEPCTLTITSDLPQGTGLGSSSALAVALCALSSIVPVPTIIAHSAYNLERTVSPVGFQDHLPASHGGFNIYKGNSEFVSRREMPPSHLAIIHKYGILFYTGKSRSAAPILQNWRIDSALHDIKALADEVSANRWTMGPELMGEYLHRTWEMKSRIKGVSDDNLNNQYSIACNAGAYGGKLLGAGGGGCWFFLCHPDARQTLKEAIGLIEIPFSIPLNGVRREIIE